MSKLFALAVAGLLALAIPAICFAETSLSVSVPADATDPVGWLVAIVGSVLVYLARRVALAVEKAAGLKLDAATSAAIDGAVDAAIRWAQKSVEGQADAALHGLALKNAVAGEALAFVEAHFGKTMTAAGLSSAVVAARIEAALGYYLPSAQPLAATVPAATVPAATVPAATVQGAASNTGATAMLVTPASGVGAVAVMGAGLLSLSALSLSALSLSGCTEQQIATGAKTIEARIASACADTEPVATLAGLAAPADPTVLSLTGYYQSVCAPDGGVVASANLDANTVAWLAALKTGLATAANLPNSP